MTADPCVEAEHRLQPYLDRVLSEEEVAVVDAHLKACGYCARRYVFEARFRETVKRCCTDAPIPPGMVDRLRLRIRSGA